MGTEHNHQFAKAGRGQPLLLCLILTLALFIAEVIGGLTVGSLALLSDAAHILTDLAALVIAFIAMKVGQRPADKLRTFGYYRLEILATALNTSLLFFISLYILYEAYERLYNPAEVHSVGMLMVATASLIVNFVLVKLLRGTKDKSLSIKAAYLEVWSDMLSSIGVIVGAALIKATDWLWIDTLIAVLISIWILPRSWVLLKESINILLEGVPKGVDLNKITQSALQVEGVLDIHELHVWAITSDKINLTAHVITDQKYDYERVLSNLRQLLVSKFSISHTTLQHEREKCHAKEANCCFNQ